MASVNKAIIIGNLGKDPELKYTPQGKTVCNFSVATSESWKDASGQKQEKTEWHNILCWGKTAELAGQYLKKGRSCYIEGKIQTRSWDDKDGQKRYKTEIEAQNITFLGGDKSSGSDSHSEPAQSFSHSDLPF
jgi:single-strand DNA-binding protein